MLSASARNNSALASNSRPGKLTGFERWSARRSGAKQSGHRAFPEQGGLFPETVDQMMSTDGQALSSAPQFRVGGFVFGNGPPYDNCAFRLVGILPSRILGYPLFKVTAAGPVRLGQHGRKIQSTNGMVRGATFHLREENIQTVAAFKAQDAATRATRGAAAARIQALVRGYQERRYQSSSWPRLDPSAAASMDELSAMSDLSTGMLAQAEARAEATGCTLPRGWLEAAKKGLPDQGVVLPANLPVPAGSAAPGAAVPVDSPVPDFGPRGKKKKREKQYAIMTRGGSPVRPKQLAIVEPDEEPDEWGTACSSNSPGLAIQVFYRADSSVKPLPGGMKYHSDGESDPPLRACDAGIFDRIAWASSDSSDDGADDPDSAFDRPPPQIDTNIMPIAPASNAAGGALSPATPAQSPNPVASSAAASSSSAAVSKKRKQRGGIELVDWDPRWFQKRRRRSATTRTYSEMKGKDNFKEMPTVVHMANSVARGNGVELAVSWVISEDPEGPWRHI